MLLFFSREMIDGHTPLHLAEKPTPGTGGSLLIAMLCYPALGGAVSAVAMPTDEGESRRTIFSLLGTRPDCIFLDNIDGLLKSPTLCSAITADHFTDRIVSSSRTGSYPVRCVWVASGNNPSLFREVARRTVRIRLDAKTEHPDIDREFRIKNLAEWAESQRCELIAANVTIIQAWIAAGKPRFAGKRLGGFESWSDVMGGILQNANIPGFLDGIEEHREQADPKRQR